MARTTARSQARDAALKRQESANAARSKYDAEELETLTRLDLARHRRNEAAKNLAAAERDMATELERLFDMGNSLERILLLTGETNRDTIKKLRKLASPNGAPKPAWPMAAAPGGRASPPRRGPADKAMVPTSRPEPDERLRAPVP
jgi:hypothetical protein